MSNELFSSLAGLITKVRDRRVVTLIAVLVVFTTGCKGPAPDGMPRGKELFASCASCHGDNGSGNAEFLAPQIAGLSKQYVLTQISNFQKNHRGVHPDDLAGHRMNPMARHVKTEADLNSLAEYVSKLSAPKPSSSEKFGGDPIKGKASFATCAACHGSNGEGKPAMKAPALNNTHDWYLLSQLKKFDKGIRGYSDADTQGQIMVQSVKILQSNEATMRDVVAYIMTLKK